LKRLSGMKRKFHVPFFGGKSPAKGLPTRRLNMEGDWNGAEGKNKYQYNDKEWNDDFGLGWNDYGAPFWNEFFLSFRRNLFAVFLWNDKRNPRLLSLNYLKN
jgi:hypothetical protein